MSKTAAIVTPADELEIAPSIDLKEMTEARVALGRFGAGLPTRAAQAFLLDHARAREAVWTSLDQAALEERLTGLDLSIVHVDSMASDRSTYIRRPDLGRLLTEASTRSLREFALDTPSDIAIIIADGLSASAVELNAVPLLQALVPKLKALKLQMAPIVLARQARVALGDPVGEALGAKVSILLVGERPGLSAADSLGVYITYHPKSGRSDSARNCISNIRNGGLATHHAAEMISALIYDILRTQVSGVALKDAVAKLSNKQM